MTKWTSKYTNPVPGGSVGGDDAHDAVTVILTNDKNDAGIVVSYFVVDSVERYYDGNEDAMRYRLGDLMPYDVESMTEYVNAIGVGDTSYDVEWTLRGFANLEEAEKFRDYHAQDMIDNVDEYVFWDGVKL